MGTPVRKRRGQVKRWIRKHRVWHVRAKRYIYRKDGKDFLFPVYG